MRGRPSLDLGTHGTISARTNAAGKWVAKTIVRDLDGVSRQVQRLGATKGKAVAALKLELRDRVAPTIAEITADSSVKDLVKVWREEFDQQTHAPGTVLRYRTIIDLHILPSVGAWRISEASAGKLDRLVKAKRASSGSSTAELMRSLLIGIFDVAARLDALPSNPARAVAAVVSAKREISAFTLADVAELRAILLDWDAGLDRSGRRRTTDLADPVDMFLATACRPGEIFAMGWEGIDFGAEKSAVLVDRTMAKNLQGKWKVQHLTKGKRPRELVLPLFATEMLLRRRVEATTGLVFPSSTGTPRIPDNFRVQWHAALAGTRFEGRTPKEFRATVATFLRENSGIESAQLQLGHSSLVTTESFYAKRSVRVDDHSETLERIIGRV